MFGDESMAQECIGSAFTVHSNLNWSCGATKFQECCGGPCGKLAVPSVFTPPFADSVGVWKLIPRFWVAFLRFTWGLLRWGCRCFFCRGSEVVIFCIYFARANLVSANSVN